MVAELVLDPLLAVSWPEWGESCCMPSHGAAQELGEPCGMFTCPAPRLLLARAGALNVERNLLIWCIPPV